MCDPWKRQVIWQNLVERETLHYAHLEEMKGNSLPPAPSPDVLQPQQSEEDPVAAFNSRLPSLPLAASSTGTLHHIRRSSPSSLSPPSQKEYRHGFGARFSRKRNASGGFFGM